MADHRTRRPSSAVALAGATAGMTAVLAFGHVADAFAATLPGNAAVVGVGGKDNPTSDRVQKKFDGQYVPYNGGYAGPADDRFYGVNYPATLPIDESVAEGRQPLIDTVAEARTAVGADGTIYIVSYSEGTIVAEKYKRELNADPVDPGGNIEFVFIASPTVPNGGIYARFPNLGPLSLLGFTSTGASAPTSYDQTFLTIEYDPVGDFPAYANPLSLANAAAGFLYLHGDPTPDAADLNDPDAVIVKPVTKPGAAPTPTSWSRPNICRCCSRSATCRPPSTPRPSPNRYSARSSRRSSWASTWATPTGTTPIPRHRPASR